MAEIKIQKKKRGRAWLWILIILLLAFAAVLFLDSAEVISSPDWIENHQSYDEGEFEEIDTY